MAAEVKDRPLSEEDAKKESAGKVAEYLQAPRKKRRKYITVALGPKFNRELGGAISNFLRKTYQQNSFSFPKAPEELERSLGRSMQLLVVDDEFSALEHVLHMVYLLKTKKQQAGAPVLFLTRDPKALIKGYNEKLSMYHEVDDYIPYLSVSPKQILATIKSGVESSNRRRARRYKVDIPLAFYDLRSNALLQGRITDLSAFGGVLASPPGHIFRHCDQFRINLPLPPYIVPKDGDFLRLSCRVRRVFISGNEVGFSFEHVSEKQLFTLTEFLTAMVTFIMGKSSMGLSAIRLR